MHPIVARLQGSQPLRYIFIGGVSYLIELSALLALAHPLSLSSELAVAISFWIGLIISFLLQKYIAFGSKDSARKVVGKQAVMYGALVVFNYFFTIAFVSLFVGLLGLVIARTVALIITTLWNYVVYKKIFKTDTTSA